MTEIDETVATDQLQPVTQAISASSTARTTSDKAVFHLLTIAPIFIENSIKRCELPIITASSMCLLGRQPDTFFNLRNFFDCLERIIQDLNSVLIYLNSI